MQEQPPSETDPLVKPATGEAVELVPLPKSPVPWWNHEDFPYSAPWWVRYPTGIAVLATAYYGAFEWGKTVGWLAGAILAFVGLALLRELFLGSLLAIIVGLLLWAIGAAAAALPVSLAIIIGAIIIALAMRR